MRCCCDAMQFGALGGSWGRAAKWSCAFFGAVGLLTEGLRAFVGAF